MSHNIKSTLRFWSAMPENPVSLFKLKLESLIKEGQTIAGRLSELKISAGNVCLAGVVGKEWFPERRGLIRAAERLLGAQGSVQETRLDAEIANWLGEIGRTVTEVPTGRRRGEVTATLKRKWLKDLAKQCDIKNARILVLRATKTLSRIVIDASKLETQWRPRGKVIVGGRVLEGREEIVRILKGIDKGPLIVCDPYVSSDTLTALESVPLSVSIILLTEKIQDRQKFMDYIRRLRDRGWQLKVGVFDVKSAEKPHDRFIVSPTRAWMIGGSIKDIGRKDTMIIEVDTPGQVRGLMMDYVEGRRGAVRME